MNEKLRKTIIYLALIACGLFMIVPFIWMISTALMSQAEFNKGEAIFIPKENYNIIKNSSPEQKVIVVRTMGDSSLVHFLDADGKITKEYIKVETKSIKNINKRISIHWDNFIKVFKKVPFARYFANTLYVSFLSLLGVLVTSAFAAYAFSRMVFRGRDMIFLLFISMVMVPEPIYIITSYLLLDKLAWLDTYRGLIIPWWVNVFTVFLFRQHFKSLPKELFDAASIDGCSTFSMLTKIILPLSKPVIATASVFSIIGSWNSFMWPLVMTTKEELRLLQVGLSYFNAEASAQTTLLMAASTFSIVPILILFFLAQKQIIESTAKTGLKD
ncbi:MAG: carbohydrate ABC transporter permease [Candidatus Cloacimonetes bacterium]|nr:carbohydrate ABC transporter permease [Candidatus Cloacimonadota bacterium]